MLVDRSSEVHQKESVRKLETDIGNISLAVKGVGVNRTMTIPEKYNPTETEEKWAKKWDLLQLYSWNPAIGRENSFVVDTPPPTVSGSLHIGHVFSYVHTDILARFHRMNGKNVMYPMGFDDNGLPTERRVQNMLGINCDPAKPYDPDFSVSGRVKGEQVQNVSRRNFIDACHSVTKEDEKAFQRLWKHLGLSVDWNEEYTTIGSKCQTISQHSFLDLLDRGLIYNIESPTVWDVTFQTAVAQAELEDRMVPGFFHELRFAVKGGGEFTISTTRPELLPACIAIVAHPSDERYQHLFGKTAITPLFSVEVPILPSEHADPGKGSGIMMVCTFGDGADLAWWRSSGMALRTIIGRDGKLLSVDFGKEPFSSLCAGRANASYSRLVGRTMARARKEIALMLAEQCSGPDGVGAALVGELKPTTHAVKFYEKGELPVEYVSSRQWYCRLLDFKDQLLELGMQIQWHPDHMRSRYEHWVKGLNSDWCISRQRFFGVPFPVWYRLNEEGMADYKNPILANKDMLPVDPMSQPPPGFSNEQRGKPGGFIGDPDVMDTWATSSLTPLIVPGWTDGNGKHDSLFPMDVRPQSHEIIRTWAFYTIAKSYFHCGKAPWKHVAISGWILDPDRKKMSKSKGNVVTPDHLLEKYSSDGVRYWSARARLGVDTAFDEKVMEMGRKLSVKLFNATKFVLQQVSSCENLSLDWRDMKTLSPVDRSWLGHMQKTIERCSRSFSELDHASALGVAEETFWDFCDNYLELVKGRCYQGQGEDRRSSLVTIAWTMDNFLRLFAPFLPYITEEMWQHCPWRKPDTTSIHLATWPNTDELDGVSIETNTYDLGRQILGEIRKTKAEAKKSMRCPVKRLSIKVANRETLDRIASLKEDIIRAAVVDGTDAFIEELSTNGSLEVEAKLGEAPSPGQV